MLKKNGCQESIISKIFKRITNIHNLLQSQQQTQATYIQKDEIKMSIHLPHVEGPSKKTQISQNEIHFIHWKHFG